MPQIQTTVLADRQSTPVNHSFVPVDIAQPGSVGILQTVGAFLIGVMRLSLGMRRTPSGKYRGFLNLDVPVVQEETINGITKPVVVRTAYIRVQVTWDAGSTFDERNNAIGLLRSALDPTKVLVNDTLVKCEAVY